MHQQYRPGGTIGMAIGQGPAQAIVPIRQMGMASLEQHIDDGKGLIELNGRQVLPGKPHPPQQEVSMAPRGLSKGLQPLEAADRICAFGTAPG